MKIEVESQAFAEALKAIRKPVRQTTMGLPALYGVILRHEDGPLKVIATDLEVWMERELPAEVNGEDFTSVLLPSALLSDLVGAAPSGKISLEASDGQAVFQAGGFTATLRLLSAEDYPERQEPEGAEADIPARPLIEAVSRIVRAASRDDVRPILQGLHLKAENGKLVVAATDSYRLAFSEIDVGEDCPDAELTVPAKPIADLLSTLEIDDKVILSFGDRHLGVFAGGTWATVRLIEGQFPNWRQLVPEKKTFEATLTADVEELAAAVARTATLVEPRQGVRLSVRKGKVKLESTSPDRGSATSELEAKCKGEIEISFNPQFLLDGIAVVGGKKVTLHMADAIKPALLEAEGSPYTYVVMPIRIPQAVS